MREPCYLGGYSFLGRPAHNPRYENAALVVTRSGGVLRCRGARRCVGSCVRGAHLFIETATSTAHHGARRYGPPEGVMGCHGVSWGVSIRGL